MESLCITSVTCVVVELYVDLVASVKLVDTTLGNRGVAFSECVKEVTCPLVL